MLFSQFQPIPRRDDEPRFTLALNGRESAFLLDAARHYCDCRCPLKDGADFCPLLAWRESVFTGALERVCAMPPGMLEDRLAKIGRNS